MSMMEENKWRRTGKAELAPACILSPLGSCLPVVNCLSLLCLYLFQHFLSFPSLHTDTHTVFFGSNWQRVVMSES